MKCDTPAVLQQKVFMPQTLSSTTKVCPGRDGTLSDISLKHRLLHDLSHPAVHRDKVTEQTLVRIRA